MEWRPYIMEPRDIVKLMDATEVMGDIGQEGPSVSLADDASAVRNLQTVAESHGRAFGSVVRLRDRAPTPLVPLAPSAPPPSRWPTSSVGKGSPSRLSSVAGNGGDAVGPSRCDAPLPRSRLQLAGEHGPHGGGSCGDPLHARGVRPGPRRRQQQQPAVQHGDLDAAGAPQPAMQLAPREDGDTATGGPLWMQPPAWLYLPHLGIGCGMNLVGTAAACGHVEVDDGESSPQDGADLVDGSSRRAPIRGRFGSGLQPPGPVDDRRTPSSVRVGEIRGRAAPGAVGGQGAAGTRAAARLAAQHAPIQQSLEDHAERVAKRRRCGDAPSLPTPAERLAALRARVAARASEEQPARNGGAAVAPAAAHAASRVAQHGVVRLAAD